MFKRIMKYADKDKRETFMASLCILMAVLMSVIPFILAYQVITPLVMGKSLTAEDIGVRVGGVLLCMVLHSVFYVKGLALSHHAAFNILEKIRISIQLRIEKLPLGVIQEKGIGAIKRLFVDDVESMETLLAHAIPEGVGNSMIPIIVYVILFITDWKLALMSLFSVIAGSYAMGRMYHIGTAKMGQYYQAGRVMNNTIIEYINGMEVVKVFNKDGESYERFKRDVTNYKDFTLEWYKSCWPWMALYNSLIPCTVLLTLPLGSYFVLRGFSTLPDLILVLCLSFSVGVPMLRALSFIPQFPQLDYKLESIEQMIEAEPLQQTKEGFHGKNHSISFENVTFSYAEQPVLQGVDMKIQEGQTVALVGESGSGKSTLAKLLVHYYDVLGGSIQIGGQDIRKMSLEALNEQISYVSQEQYLFNTSLFENIRIGKLDATEAEVMEAAKKAECMEFLEKLPDGIYTSAGDGGKQLSGGQRQRIALARAILKSAPIVVLDEATAFTDPENEEKMNAAIAEVVKGKTLLVIAHKLTSIMNADKICVMEHGNLIAEGKHTNLLENCAVYKKLWEVSVKSAEWRVGEEASNDCTD